MLRPPVPRRSLLLCLLLLMLCWAGRSPVHAQSGEGQGHTAARLGPGPGSGSRPSSTSASQALYGAVDVSPPHWPASDELDDGSSPAVVPEPDADTETPATPDFEPPAASPNELDPGSDSTHPASPDPEPATSDEPAAQTPSEITPSDTDEGPEEAQETAATSEDAVDTDTESDGGPPPGPLLPEDGSTGSAEPVQPPPAGIACEAQDPVSTSILAPLYLVDHQTHGAGWHVDFFMLDGWKTVDDLSGHSHPDVCVGDFPIGCDTRCLLVECGRAATDGLGLHQVGSRLSEGGTIQYNNNVGQATSLSVPESLPATHPELALAPRTHSIHSSDSFSSWFALNRSSGPLDGPNFVLANATFQRVAPPAGRPVSSFQHYMYSCDPCFPLDELLWGAQNDGQQFRVGGWDQAHPAAPATFTSRHNYGFTGQVHTAFQWHGEEPGAGEQYLTVYATDDAWVFIDGQLVLDMGGTHALMCRTLDLLTGVVTGGLADFIEGEYSCPDTPLPPALQKHSFDPSVYAAGRTLPLSFFFTQRSAPHVVEGQVLPIHSVWRVETNIDLQGALDDAEAAPLIPKHAPTPAPRTRREEPPPGFTVSSLQSQLEVPSNGFMRTPRLLGSSSVLHLHRDVHSTETLLVQLNTRPTSTVLVTCSDSLALVSSEPVLFPACESVLERATSISYEAEGRSTVACVATSDDDDSDTNNFAKAEPVTFGVRTLSENLPPVAHADMEGVVGFGPVPRGDDNAQPDIFALLSGARSFDPDGVLTSARWMLVSPTSVLPTPAFDSPTSLSSFVRHLARGVEYVFQLAVTDDLGADYARTSLAIVHVNAPESNPYPIVSTASTTDDSDASSATGSAPPSPPAPTPSPVDSPAGIILVCSSVADQRIVNQTALNDFERSTLSSVITLVSKALTPMPDNLSERVLVAQRMPPRYAGSSPHDLLSLTLLIRAARTSSQPPADLIAFVIHESANDPTSQLRQQRAFLLSAMRIHAPTTVQPHEPDDPVEPPKPLPVPDSRTEDSSIKAGVWTLVFGVLFVLTVLALLLAWWTRRSRVRSFAPMTEEGASMVDQLRAGANSAALGSLAPPLPLPNPRMSRSSHDLGLGLGVTGESYGELEEEESHNAAPEPSGSQVQLERLVKAEAREQRRTDDGQVQLQLDEEPL